MKFCAVPRKVRTAEQILRVLRKLRPTVRIEDVTLTPLGRGGQAGVYRVKRRDGKPWKDSRSQLAVKIYNAGTPDVERVVREEYASLERLYSRLDGQTVHGWHICCPQPLLYTVDPPFGLIMTVVPGLPLTQQLTATPASQPDAEADSIAGAVVEALDRYWAGEARLYGDLSVSNILCDRQDRILSFIDASVPRSYYHCDGVSREWYPASRDMANMFHVAATAVRTNVLHPGRRRHRLEMSQRIARALLERQPRAAERSRLLEEILLCADVHLSQIPVSLTIGGLWRRLVRQMGRRSTLQYLEQLKSLPLTSAPSSRVGVDQPARSGASDTETAPAA